MAKRRNILIVTTSFPRWRGEFDGIFVLKLAQQLKHHFGVFVLAPHCKGAAKSENWDGVEIRRFRYFFASDWQKICYGPGILPNIKEKKILILILPFLFLFQFIAIIRIIFKENIDLINAHWFVPSGFTSLLAARISGRPLVTTSHGPDIISFKDGFIKKISKFVAVKSNLVTVISPRFIEMLADGNLTADRIASASMGVDSDFFKPNTSFKLEGEKNIFEKTGIRSVGNILLYAGALVKHKALDDMLKAMPEVLEKFSDTVLIVVGKGPNEEYFKNLSEEMQLTKNVFFVGSVPNEKLRKYYNRADVFVLPSLIEGLPVVLMEAMSCGCPVVATNIAGNPDMVKNGESGFLVNTHSPQEISQAIIKLISDSGLREKISKNCRKTIERDYDWKIVGNRFKIIYEKLL